MNLIVAVDENWGIGRDNKLLASLPGDMAYFKERTLNKVVVMGRKTLESLPAQRGLPKRTNIVLTTNAEFEAERCIVVHSRDELLAELAGYDTEDVFIIGGARIYADFYEMCDRLYITKMYADLGADAFMVNIDRDERFAVVSESAIREENGIRYRFLVYERVEK